MSGKNIIVTGGSKGIGRAIVETLATEGNRVVFSYNSGSESSRELADSLAKNGCTAWSFKADSTKTDEVQAFVAFAKEKLGGIDALVNNAGITRDKSLFIMPKEDWDDVIATNLTGYFNVTRALIGHFMKNKKGCVVNIGSVGGLSGVAGQTNYCASKAGIIGFTRALAREVAKTGVRVVCVAPGFIETDMTAKMTEKQLEEIRKSIPVSRMGTPREVADCVSFLLSDKAQYITGSVLTVDGGLSA
ncbi:MAG TPA: 3-oxoacyl-[acyl-carrier-protein] reductase [Chitinivibrionales bacterium]|jgi:3-oxoacyl-[acyl-carrier protein] reductase|nr:3-oxoacyl-[acyl-carrier-protein] reductase [Chitinivibrionales bacterium]